MDAPQAERSKADEAFIIGCVCVRKRKSLQSYLKENHNTASDQTEEQ